MENENLQLRVEDWVNKQVSIGKKAFSLEMLAAALPQQSQTAIKQSLNRLSRKRKLASVHKGYYVIVSPEYAAWELLPPTLFIDGLMRYLNRPYYIGLLNAAAFYGAAHQSPQEFFVFTNFPVMRPTEKKGVRINYISKKTIVGNLLENKKTETGFLKVSSPELTAADVVQFHKRIGGLNRAAAVLEELAEAVVVEKINQDFLCEVQIAVIQRLGYLFETVIGRQELSDRIYDCTQSIGLKFFPVPLNSAKKGNGFSADNRWKVIANVEIELD